MSRTQSAVRRAEGDGVRVATGVRGGEPSGRWRAAANDARDAPQGGATVSIGPARAHARRKTKRR